MTDSDRREIATIVNKLLTEHLTDMKREIAEGFVAATEGMMQDLSGILDARTGERIREIAERESKERQRISHRKVGFIP